jgi:hypothetical protein
MDVLIAAGMFGWLMSKWWKYRQYVLVNIFAFCCSLWLFLPVSVEWLRHFTAVG